MLGLLVLGMFDFLFAELDYSSGLRIVGKEPGAL